MMLAIHPETKIGVLLEAYPALEGELIACSPEFARLRNPVLRKTVAKLATLEQAAKIAGIGVQDLVRRLRQAAGQDAGESRPAGADEFEMEPDWVRKGRLKEEIDAEPMLRAGEHPLGRVRRSAGGLTPGETVRLISPFHPAPLIDVLRQDGFAVYSTRTGPGRHETVIGRI